MLFPHLLNRKSFVTELPELDKFFLNLLQSFLPVAVSDVGFCSLLASKSILFVQLLNVSNFRPKTSNLSPKNFKMIHSGKDNASVSWERWRASYGNSFSLVSFDEVTHEIQAQRRAAAERDEAERRVAQELDIAKPVQARLFLQDLPVLRTLEYAEICQQARHVGGNYYDFLATGRE